MQLAPLNMQSCRSQLLECTFQALFQCNKGSCVYHAFMQLFLVSLSFLAAFCHWCPAVHLRLCFLPLSLIPLHGVPPQMNYCTCAQLAITFTFSSNYADFTEHFIFMKVNKTTANLSAKYKYLGSKIHQFSAEKLD